MSFALITGASKGIGRHIATELAKRKIDLLLVARSEEALRQAAEELTAQYGISVFYKAIDLSRRDSPQVIYDWCVSNQYEIAFLINNAGFGLSGKFESYPLQDQLEQIEVNVNSLVQLCYLFLPMLKRQPQAHILNMASSAAYQAVPSLAVYAASKAFVLRFSRALSYELKGTSVAVTTISPGATDTAFNVRANIGEKGMKTAEKVIMQPEAVAAYAVKKMFQCKTESVVGFLNKLTVFFVGLLPKKFVEKTAAGIYEE